MGPVTPEERADLMQRSPLAGRYDTALDRDSAYESLNGRAHTIADIAPQQVQVDSANPWGTMSSATPWGQAAIAPPAARRAAYDPPARARRVPEPEQPQDPLMSMLLGNGRREGVAEAFTKSIARSLGGSVGRSVVRGLLGSILKR